MGVWSDWYEKNAGKESSLVNAEWVLKKIDEGSSRNAPNNITLNDATESSVLPATASAPIATLLQTIRNNLKHLFNNKVDKSNVYTKTEVINTIYPIGSIYLSVNNTNPGTYLTGTTWAAWGSGKVPVGVDASQTEFNTVEKSDGAKTSTNVISGGGTSGSTTLTINQIPSHTHTYADASAWSGNMRDNGDASTWAGNIASGTTGSTGGGQGHTHSTPNHQHTVSTLQPYITCYMFKRIA
jgi:hypothetical protein